jgi:hypothetical protein
LELFAIKEYGKVLWDVWERPPVEGEVMHDIFDGSIDQEALKHGKISSGDVILLGNIDGFRVFHGYSVHGSLMSLINIPSQVC